MRIELTEEADEDPFGITIYTLDNFGRAQADRYIDGLNAFIIELPSHQHRIKPAKTRTSGYWRAVYQSRVIFLRKVEAGLRIVRILHDKMNPDHYLP